MSHSKRKMGTVSVGEGFFPPIAIMSGSDLEAELKRVIARGNGGVMDN